MARTYFTSPRLAALLAVLAAGGALAAAFVAQYGFDLLPCELCIWQRWTLGAVLVFGLLALLSLEWMVLPLGVLAVLASLATAAVAGFHVGVERRWWSGTKSCAPPSLDKGVSLDSLREMILGQPVVRCDEPAWTLFGISMAGYNLIFSLGLGLILLGLLLARPQRRRG